MVQPLRPRSMVGHSAGIFSLILGGFILMGACSTVGGSAQSIDQRVKQSSPQWRDGKFRNDIPAVEPPFWEALFKWLAGADDTTPREPPPIVERKATDFATPPASGLRITWLGHSTFLVEIDGQRVLIDPVWSERASPIQWLGPKRFHPAPLPLQELPAIDAVVISHDHYDHLDEQTVRALADRIPLFAVPLGLRAHLERWGVGHDHIVERDWWEEVKVGNLTLVATPARHFSGRSVIMADRDATLWAGWVIKGPQHRVYYSGDTAMFPGFAEIGERFGPFDVALIETGAYNALWADVHIGPEQAVAAHQMVRGKLYVPAHWGTFDLALHSWTEPVERLLVAARNAGVPVAVPRPGESLEPALPQTLVRWWPEVPWQTASEAPVVSSGLQPVDPDATQTGLTTPSQSSHAVAAGAPSELLMRR